MLISAGAPVDVLTRGTEGRAADNNKFTPLMIACEGRHVDAVRALLERGADSEGNNKERTPLSHASRIADMDLVSVLLEYKCKVNTAPPAQRWGSVALSPLHAAAEDDNVELIRVLVKAGASINATGSGWRSHTPLQCAVSAGRVAAIHELVRPRAHKGRDAQCDPHLRPRAPTPDKLALGADINARDGQRHYHETALHVAAREKRIDIVEELIRAGADQLATNNRGRTPCVEYARARGARPSSARPPI